MRVLALVLPLEEIPLATSFLRARWPAHVTALSNFRLDLHDDELMALLDPVLAGFGPIDGRLGEEALFGPKQDIPVRLVDSAEVLDLHAALLRAVQSIATFDLPDHQGAGYRPHMTLVPDVDLPEGIRLHLPRIALAEMQGDRAQVLLTRALGPTPEPFSLVRLHHVQLAMPRGQEAVAREFWADLLGMTELEKPPVLAARGGCWFRGGGLEVHLGVEEPFAPARKAHPGVLVRDLSALVTRLEDAGRPVTWDDDFPGHRRCYAQDPFGNRLEFLEPEEA